MQQAVEVIAPDLHTEVAELDRTIIELVQRRTEICRQLTTRRLAAGSPSIQLGQENQVLQRYREAFQRTGTSLAMLLTELGRR
jgi:chorismate mutase